MKKINFADSLPSFELWFLLHYAIPKGYYENQNKLISELQRYIPNYSKERKWQESFRLYNTLKSRQNVALENAETAVGIGLACIGAGLAETAALLYYVGPQWR